MKLRSRVAISTLSLLSLGLAVFGVHLNNRNIVSVGAYTNGDAATYYNDIDQYATGNSLLSALQSLNSTKRRSTVGYNSMMNKFKQTDPGSTSGYITSFYSGKSVPTSQCNREHVWPNSHGGNMVEDDIHMVRPTLKSENEGRGNSFYVEGMNHEYDGWDPANCGVETYRGDSARIIFYCVVAYDGFELLDVNKHHTTSEDNDYKMGRLSHLLKWNLEYPVLQREKTRNEAAESLQGNRNPFIDHPEYACRIWGSYNADTQRICAGQGVSGNLEIKHNTETLTKFDLEIDDEETLSAFVGGSSSGTYTWSLSNIYGSQILSDVISLNANGNDVTITGTQTGSVYLKAAVTINLPNGTTESLWKVIEITVHPKTTLSDLRIDSFPYKTDYYVGEQISFSGLKVVASYSDGSEVDVTNHIIYDDYDVSTPGVKTISFSYTFKDRTLTNSFSVIIRSNSTPSGGGSSGGCGGNIAVTSALLSSFALAGLFIIGVSLKRRKK